MEENGETKVATFIYIFINIILPIFLLVAIGYTFQKKLKMDVRTFTWLNIYIFIPAVLFTKVYNAKVTLQFFGTIFVYIMIIILTMYLLGELVSRIFKYPRTIKKAFSNSLLFFNSGNYGLPLAELVFKGDPLATSVQIFIMLIQNITGNTFGVFQASSGSSSYKKALKNVLLMPSPYVLVVVVIVKITKLQVPEMIMEPLQYISNGFIAIALLTLGVQLAGIKFDFKFRDIFLSCFIRLMLSPLIGLLLVTLLGVKGILAQSLIIGASTPTAVNTAIIAKEYDNEPNYCSQIVFVSTIISAITISSVIFFVRKL
jgi:malate permease and related proteins